VTIFDLLFIIAFLSAVVLLVLSAIAVIRRRRARAVALLRNLGIFVAVYFSIVILVSLLSPRRVLHVGDVQCWDDWCIAVADAQRQPTDAGVAYGVTFLVSSRARGRPQRERGVQVYLMDDRGRRYDPLPDQADQPFDVLLQPSETMQITRTFALPAEVHAPVLVVSHGGHFPACCIIGDSESLFHKPTVVQLD